jgi:PAS domain S-box-containing protein
MNRGIAVKMTVIFSGLLLLATAITGYMVHQEARSSLMKSSTERLEHTAEVVSVRMLASLEAITKDVRFLASTPPVQGIIRARMRRGLDPETALLDSEWRAQLADIFNVFVDNRPSYTRVSFSDLRAHPTILVAISSETPRSGWSDSDEYARAREVLPADTALTKGYVYLSNIEMRESAEGGPTIPMMHAVVPVFDATDVLFGALTVHIDLRDILTGLTSVVGRDKSLFIANDGGELLADPEGPYAKEELGGDGLQYIQGFLTAGGASAPEIGSIKQDLDGKIVGTPGIAYFDRILYDALNTERHARLAVVSPTTDILDVVNNVERRSVLIVLLFSLVGAVSSLLLSRFLTLPLRRITDAISHFGEDCWNVELPTSRTDEIGVLARAFSKMADHIRYQLRILEEKERHQRVILETAAEGIVVADGRGFIEELNPAAERLFGFSADELKQRHLTLLLPPQLQNAPFDTTGGGASWLDIGTGHEVVGLQKNGSTIQLSLSVSEFKVGDESRLAIFLEDISDRKDYEQALRVAKEKAEEMVQLKSAFLANMSHELRTPLTAVIGYASMLATELSAEHEQFAQLIERSGRRLMDTLNAVLSLAQLESQQMRVELSEIDVAEVVEETATFFEAHAASRGLAFRFLCSPPAVGARARVDPGALNSVLQNLIGNAIKFTESGFVEVRVHAANERVFIEVRDTGIGIDRLFLPHLFEEFRQESTGMERSHEGSGLGLALTNRLVDLMGGEIRVESEKGEGTMFTISFPQVPSQSPAERTSAEPDASRVRSGWNEAQILIIEDNPETAMLVRRVLAVAGDVTLAFDADEALRKASRIPFDLVLCDINLGGSASGVDVLASLRDLPSYAGVPIVALTAYALPGDEERFVKRGFDEYVSKPFTPDELLKRVYRLLEGHEHRQPASMLPGDGILESSGAPNGRDHTGWNDHRAAEPVPHVEDAGLATPDDCDRRR